MSHIPRAVVLGVLLALPAACAWAQIKEVTLVGKVLSVISPGGVLASYGVKVGARVDVTYQVNLATPPFSQSGPPENVTHYNGAVTWILIDVGSWRAIRLPPTNRNEINLASVADDSGEDADVDLLELRAEGTDNDLVLTQSLSPGTRSLLSLSFNEPFGYASADQSLDQDPARYAVGTGAVQGPGGHVLFTIDTARSRGPGGAASSAAACGKAQLQAAGTLCRAQLRCHARHARAPAKDPLGMRRETCLAKAGQRFTKAYDKAADRAERKGLTCGTAAPAADQHDVVAGWVDEILADVDAVTPPYSPLSGAWLAAAAAACDAGLAAEASQQRKPNAKALGKARDKARDRLDAAAGKAVAAAGKQGVVFTPAPDVDGFAAGVEAAVRGIHAAVGGD